MTDNINSQSQSSNNNNKHDWDSRTMFEKSSLKLLVGVAKRLHKTAHYFYCYWFFPGDSLQQTWISPLWAFMVPESFMQISK